MNARSPIEKREKQPGKAKILRFHSILKQAVKMQSPEQGSGL
jgi:hypothetical protein